MPPEETAIDVWMQHPNLDFINHAMFASLRRWMGMTTVTEPIPVEWTLAAMDQGRVGRGLISAWWGPQGPLIANEEVAGLVERHPDRFIGIGAVDLHRPMAAVRETRRCIRELGFKGIRIVQWFWNLPPTDRLYYPVYAECAALEVPVCLQVGHTGPLCPSEPGRPIPYIDQVALDFPELKLVCGHIGYPWTTEMIAVATKHPNVFIDTSAYTARRYPGELVEYMKRNGRNKVLFGTNYPMITPAKCREDLGSLGLDDETLALFLSGNAERVFAIAD
ncbi:MAG: amidohydrolase family protein [Thermodesulfobacteriota bacterium]